MKIRLAVSILVVASVVVGASTDRGSADQDRDALAALEQQWISAQHDRGVLDGVLADDFLHPVPAGVFLSKAQHIDWAVTHPAPTGGRQRFEQMRIRTYNGTGIVTGLVVSTDAHGRESRRTVFTDVFVRRKGRWQAVNAQENEVAPFTGH